MGFQQIFPSAPSVKGYPNPKTIVFAMSSNGAGRGSSTYPGDPTAATNWASPATSTCGLITAGLKVQDPNWRTYNRSISGSHTKATIDRFQDDIAIHRPSHIVFGTNIANEPLFSTDPFAAALVYARNSRTLAQMAQSIGAIPIQVSPYPFNGYTPTSFAAVLDCLCQLEQSGVPLVDYMSALADLSSGSYGNFRVGGYDVDGTHVNDAGHAVYFDAWDLSLFNSAYDSLGTPDVGKGAWKITTIPTGIYFDLAAGCRSFAMRCRIMGAANADGSASQMAVYNYGNTNAPTRVRNNALYNLTDGPSSTSATSTIDPTQDLAVHDLGISYNDVTKKAQFFIDGAQIGSDLTVSQTGIQAATRFAFGYRPDTNGGSSRNLTFAKLNAWRSPIQLMDFQTMAFTGRVPTRSLVLKSELNHNPRKFLTNSAMSDVLPIISGTWAQVAAI